MAAHPQFQVNTDALNLRSAPVVNTSNRIAVLPRGQVVDKIAGGATGWWEVSTAFHGAALQGFVSSSFLAPAGNFQPPPALNGVVEVYLGENNANAKRNSTGSRAYPIGEAGRPTRTVGAPGAQRSSELTTILDWLDVEQSARYRPVPGSFTYCNIYATDYCYLGKAYLPRMFWTRDAVVDLQAGIPVTPIYGETIVELNANSLFAWLKEFGQRFGWRRTFDIDDLQNSANTGEVCVISAQRTNSNRSGHICAVVPETTVRKAARNGARVVQPLQSQAGRTNHKYMTSSWWTMDIFREFGFWVHP